MNFSQADFNGWGGCGFMGPGMMGYGGVGSVFGLVTWILVIAVLFALARWLWMKGDLQLPRK